MLILLLLDSSVHTAHTAPPFCSKQSLIYQHFILQAEQQQRTEQSHKNGTKNSAGTVSSAHVLEALFLLQ